MSPIVPSRPQDEDDAPPLFGGGPEPGRALLFAYGLLQPQFRPPASMAASWPDRVRGLLYDLGPYPGATEVGLAERWFSGYVLDIAEAEFAALDAFEGDRYRRIRAETERGTEVWIYELAQPLPESAAGPLDCWPAEGRV